MRGWGENGGVNCCHGKTDDRRCWCMLLVVGWWPRRRRHMQPGRVGGGQARQQLGLVPAVGQCGRRARAYVGSVPWLPQRLLFWWNLFGAMAQLKSNFAVGLFLWACLPPEAHPCPQDRHRCSRLATLVRGCAVCGSQHPACLGEHAQAVRASLRRMDAACPSLAALAVIGLGRENKAGHGGKAH